MILMAGLIAGAVNRRLNNRGELNYKDDMADRIIDELGLTLQEKQLPGLDAAALFSNLDTSVIDSLKITHRIRDATHTVNTLTNLASQGGCGRGLSKLRHESSTISPSRSCRGRPTIF